MSKPRVMVLRAPGTNCDMETVHAWHLVGATCDLHHVDRVLENAAMLGEYDVLTLPGGFSYGDDIAAGRILAARLVNRIGDMLHAFVDRGGLVLGICNGFQVLTSTGLLTAGQDVPCTLAFNDSGVFTCRWVTLECKADHCVFLEPGRKYFLPIAHAEGRFAIPDGAELDHRRVALAYVDGDRRVGEDNPNGSVANVAGLTNATGRVFGLMPHPERFVDRTQHPAWTSRDPGTEPDGLAIFRQAASLFT